MIFRRLVLVLLLAFLVSLGMVSAPASAAVRTPLPFDAVDRSVPSRSPVAASVVFSFPDSCWSAPRARVVSFRSGVATVRLDALHDGVSFCATALVPSRAKVALPRGTTQVRDASTGRVVPVLR